MSDILDKCYELFDKEKLIGEAHSIRKFLMNDFKVTQILRMRSFSLLARQKEGK